MDSREIRRPMFHTGEPCTQPGVYASNDCGHKITFQEDESFPECPLHHKPVDWTFIKYAA